MIVTDYLNTRYVEVSGAGCDDLPFVTLADPLAVDQDARSLADIPAEGPPFFARNLFVPNTIICTDYQTAAREASL